MERENIFGNFIREQRKLAGLTQKEFAFRSGLGLRFVRDIEQGKASVRLDKLNQALGMFGFRACPARIDE
jgi:y4mF family transcriptional regulator